MKKQVTGAIALFFAASAAAAGSEPSSFRFFGDAYLGSHVIFGSELGEEFMVPMVDLGGRLAVTNGRFGLQLDGEYSGFELGWIRPDIDVGDINARFGATGLSGHASVNFNERFKAGAYLGYMIGSVSVSGESVSAKASLDSLVYGVEALYQHDENNWIEAYAGVIDPRNVTLNLYLPVLWEEYGLDPDVLPSEDTSMPIEGLNAFNFGAALTHRFNSQWSATGKIDFTRLSFDGASANLLSLKAIGAYTLETMPLTLSASLGYVKVSSPGQSAGAFNIGTRLTFTFGDSGKDASTQLFSTRRALPGLY